MDDDAKAWYLRFETKSWTSATQTMTGWECGAYINLLSWSWDNGPILDDRKTMIMASRCPLAVTLRVLQLKWRLTENGWTNHRLENERARCLQKSEKAHASALKRWDANAMPTHLHSTALLTCDGNAIQSQSQSQSQNNATDSLAPRSKRARRQASNILWSADDGWTGITDADLVEWTLAYPTMHIDTMLQRMHLWLKRNPRKANKSDWHRFIVGWLNREGKGGDNNTGTRPTESNF